MGDSSKEDGMPGGGFLTETRWDYLKNGGQGRSDNQIRGYRYEIRKGMQNAIIDFSSVLELDPQDIARALFPLATQFGAVEFYADSEDGTGGFGQILYPKEKDIDKEVVKKGEEMYGGVVDLFTMLFFTLRPSWVVKLLSWGLIQSYILDKEYSMEDSPELEDMEVRVSFELKHEGETVSKASVESDF